ncbi:MAG: glutamine-hydrolyzing carbamoyl-phosphate synthase small subunit [Epulopiscium sp.]|nr:glutamine-hydrolyzing carbamoyl-phosphate synthase small subunit [Candidatus Epulonipiscium sp.]
MEKKSYLVLENGQVFEGKSFGAEGDVIGEIVFTTSMTGYVEALTDPSFFGQILVQTFPLIGNYGFNFDDFESKAPHLKAYIVREWCQEPSNFRSEGNLDTFLKQEGIVGLYGIDTRQLTKIIREYGVMNAKIVSSRKNLAAILAELKNYSIQDAVKNTSSKEITSFNSENGTKRVVLLDLGAKESIRKELIKRGCEVVVVPSHTTSEEILALNPNGIMLSNGPGDPSENTEVITEIAKLLEANIPTFGICLGHQLVALSQGAKTIKLKYGHRGENQPVKDTITGSVYISSQNHGYAVDTSTLPKYAKERFINANDNTCEGIDYQGMPVFTVQFHPEASGGPRDTMFLFDRFITLMGGN